MATPTPTPAVFPFEPDGGFELKEKIAYSTDILTSQSRRERRVPLSQIPRIVLSWTLTALSDGESAYLQGLMWAEFDNRWYVPRWPSARKLSGAPSAGVYTLDMVATDFVTTMKALVWRNSFVWDVMTISGITSTDVTLTGSTTFGHGAGDLVIPLLIGFVDPAFSTLRIQQMSQAQVTFTCDVVGLGVPSPGAAVSTIHGIEVLPELWNMDELTEDLNQRGEISGGQASTPVIFRPLDERQTVVSTLGWLATTRSEVDALKKFIYRRRGRLLPVWVPTMTQEVLVAVDAIATATVLTTGTFNYAPFYAGDIARRSVGIYVNGVLYPYDVSSWIGVTLTLASGLTVATPKGSNISLLKLCRLTDDFVDVIYLPGQTAAQVQFSFTEVASEVPA